MCTKCRWPRSSASSAAACARRGHAACSSLRLTGAVAGIWARPGRSRERWACNACVPSQRAGIPRDSVETDQDGSSGLRTASARQHQRRAGPTSEGLDVSPPTRCRPAPASETSVTSLGPIIGPAAPSGRSNRAGLTVPQRRAVCADPGNLKASHVHKVSDRALCTHIRSLIAHTTQCRRSRWLRPRLALTWAALAAAAPAQLPAVRQPLRPAAAALRSAQVR